MQNARDLVSNDVNLLRSADVSVLASESLAGGGACYGPRSRLFFG